MKEAPKAGIIAAERYAEFFLRHPIIAVVYLFGSVALRGDGHDVDMVIEVTDKKLGFDFLQTIHDQAKTILEFAAQNGVDASDDYRFLKDDRVWTAYSMLGLGQEIHDQEFKSITFAGRWKEWDDLIRKKLYSEAQAVEDESFRSPDLFIMPPGWRQSEEVRSLLPNWASKRPWAKRSFYDIMVLQSRPFNPQTGHFDRRRRGSRNEEKLLRNAIRDESVL